VRKPKMIYVIASYKNYLNNGLNNSVPFGVVLLDKGKLYYKFDIDEEREKLVKKIASKFDPLTFREYENTFINNYVQKGVVKDSDEEGNVIEIDVNTDPFLDYLFENYQGTYQYSKPSSVDGEDPAEIINGLMRQVVGVS